MNRYLWVATGRSQSERLHTWVSGRQPARTAAPLPALDDVLDGTSHVSDMRDNGGLPLLLGGDTAGWEGEGWGFHHLWGLPGWGGGPPHLLDWLMQRAVLHFNIDD